MAKADRKSSMVCPCCGHQRAVGSETCAACGARRVGEPLVAPEVVLPSLGAAFAALGFALAVILAFAVAWLLGNDMKVARTLLVWALGEQTEFTRSLLQADPNLRYYRVISYDAYQVIISFWFGLVPLSMIGVWLARRARRLVRRDPARFGGRRLVRVSSGLSACLFVAFSAGALSYIPTAIEHGRAKHIAETQAKMWQLDYALRKYFRENGTYSLDLSDLQSISAEPLPLVDYWGNKIGYTAASLVASKDSAQGFSNYQLVSPGPDGIPGTADDIIMRDGLIITAPTQTDLPTSLLAPEKPGK